MILYSLQHFRFCRYIVVIFSQTHKFIFDNNKTLVMTECAEGHRLSQQESEKQIEMLRFLTPVDSIIFLLQKDTSLNSFFSIRTTDIRHIKTRATCKSVAENKDTRNTRLRLPIVNTCTGHILNLAEHVHTSSRDNRLHFSFPAANEESFFFSTRVNSGTLKAPVFQSTTFFPLRNRHLFFLASSGMTGR